MERTLAPLIGLAQRVTFVGLAKNTGKTEALVSLVRELSGEGRKLAITSIGRDGEGSDAINPRIAKPRIHCPADTLVATTGHLLARSGATYDVLKRTGIRTPLGKVVIARLREPAAVEVAGPSSSAEIRTVVDEMLELGADHAIVDGSIDRRAAAAPGVADVVLMSTGAVLGREIEEVVRQTGQAVAMASLPVASDPRLRELIRRAGTGALLLSGEGAAALPARFALTGSGRDLPASPGDDRERTLVIGGVLPERLLEAFLANGTKPRLRVVAADPTRVFLRNRSPGWYRRKGLRVEVLDRVNLRAITVNPLAPLSHRLDSKRLRAAIAELRPQVPVLDVKDPGYGRGRQAYSAG
jgi:hypothetical protein